MGGQGGMEKDQQAEKHKNKEKPTKPSNQTKKPQPN